MRGQFLAALTAVGAFMALAQPASAQPYRSYQDEHVANQQCQRERQARTVGGALIGGIAGAVLGHNVAGNHGARDEGTVLGGVVGAVAGGAIGRNTVNCNDRVQGQYDPYYGQAYENGQYGDDGYRDDGYDDDLYGGPQQSGYYGDDRECRMGQVIRRDRYGREYREDAMMCRDEDGQWRPER